VLAYNPQWSDTPKDHGGRGFSSSPKLPIEQPTKFELVSSLKTAKARVVFHGTTIASATGRAGRHLQNHGRTSLRLQGLRSGTRDAVPTQDN
jgi:hypothetical protein